MSGKTKFILIAGIFVVLLIVGRLFFPIRLPDIVVPAEKVGTPLGFPLTNTVLAAWIAILLLAFLCWRASRNVQLVPSGLQNLFEALLEAFLRPVEAVAGPQTARRLLPFVFTIFAFVLTANWMGLFPGFGTVGLIEHVGEQAEHAEVLNTVNVAGVKVALLPFGPKPEAHYDASHPPELAPNQVFGTFIPALRGATTDINMTLAIAVIAMIFVQYMGFKTLGLTGYGGKFINLGEFRRSGALMGVIAVFVGLLEIVAEFARIISFTFRLFGNIFAGEVLLVVVAFLIPWGATVPFLGLELFVGFIQAFVFAMLTVVFTSTAMTSHHADDHHGEATAQPRH